MEHQYRILRVGSDYYPQTRSKFLFFFYTKWYSFYVRRYSSDYKVPIALYSREKALAKIIDHKNSFLKEKDVEIICVN